MKIKKYQAGGRAKPDSVESEMFPGKKIPRSQSNYETGRIAKMAEASKPKPQAPKPAPVKKKMQAGGKADTLKTSIATFKSRIGDTAAVKRAADSVGVSTSKAKSALQARIAAKKGGMKMGGKLAKQAAIAMSMKKKGIKPKKSK